ncbi:geranylgeranylglycerol-phosphate geranylgeranyltransferase [Flavobacterium silvaticum]|uniref:UbiA family prenyltransferase n=1 Tax=Flavobacterium silvaticum TaxID=1852020 RepID=A0A972FUT0_9FLAO|nr:geranylgeranylglycerol-phosphate geranylgeranyltransferase [Flavobacterium silvaticum]NMH28928.1 UbiA family prenyltransferase [Flavobacterium silvaticum]
MKFLKLIRYQNLILIALMQLLLHFVFLEQQTITLGLRGWQFLLLVLSCVCIAAGGYVINNIFDVESDMENKPKDVVVGRGISESTAYNIYFGLTVTGVLLGFYISNEISKPGFASIFIIVASLLYMYANSYKRYLLVGNFIVSLLLAFSVLIVGLYDLLPTLYYDNRIMMATTFGVLLDFSLFAFLLNLLREIVKDTEDVNGDYNLGMNTLPIAIGVNRAAKISFGLGIVLVILLGWYLYSYLFGLVYVVVYSLVFLIAPLVFFCVRIWQAEKQKDFYQCGQLLKWILVFGILLIGVISLNMKINAG